MISVRNTSMLKCCFTSLITRFHFPHLLWPRSPRWQFIYHCCCCSVTQSCPTLQPHGLQHTRPLCPSPSPEVCPSSCTLHRWCHPAISSSDALFSFCLQSFPASGNFPVNRLFPSGNQNTSASASVLPMSFQGLFTLGLTDMISLQSKGLSSLLQYHSSKASILRPSAFFTVQLSHPYMTIGKIIALTRQATVGKVLSLLCNMLYKLVITYFQGASIF